MNRSTFPDMDPPHIHSTRSYFNMWSDLSKGNYQEMDARNVFDGMTRSEFEEWRSPNRILEVTIHKVCYPITESILHKIFGQFGKVEDVYLCMGVERAKANVVFRSKLEAAEAFGELHGRSIYDGCCLMEIQWGLCQMPPSPAASSASPTALPSTTTTAVPTSSPANVESEVLLAAHTPSTATAVTENACVTPVPACKHSPSATTVVVTASPAAAASSFSDTIIVTDSKHAVAPHNCMEDTLTGYTPTRFSVPLPTTTHVLINDAAAMSAYLTPTKTMGEPPAAQGAEKVIPTNPPSKCSRKCVSSDVDVLKFMDTVTTVWNASLTAISFMDDSRLGINKDCSLKHLQGRYIIAITQSLSSSITVLPCVAIGAHECQKVLESMTSQSTLVFGQLHAHVFGKEQCPPPLCQTIQLCFSFCPSVSYSWVNVQYQPPWPPPLLCEMQGSQHNVKLFFQCISGECLERWLEFYVTTVQVSGVIIKQAIARVQLTQGAFFFFSEACMWNSILLMAVFLQCPFWNDHCTSCQHNMTDRNFVLWISWKIPGPFFWEYSVHVHWLNILPIVVVDSARKVQTLGFYQMNVQFKALGPPPDCTWGSGCEDHDTFIQRTGVGLWLINIRLFQLLPIFTCTTSAMLLQWLEVLKNALPVARLIKKLATNMFQHLSDMCAFSSLANELPTASACMPSSINNWHNGMGNLIRWRKIKLSFYDFLYSHFQMNRSFPPAACSSSEAVAMGIVDNLKLDPSKSAILWLPECCECEAGSVSGHWMILVILHEFIQFKYYIVDQHGVIPDAMITTSRHLQGGNNLPLSKYLPLLQWPMLIDAQFSIRIGQAFLVQIQFSVPKWSTGWECISNSRDFRSKCEFSNSATSTTTTRRLQTSPSPSISVTDSVAGVSTLAPGAKQPSHFRSAREKCPVKHQVVIILFWVRRSWGPYKQIFTQVLYQPSTVRHSVSLLVFLLLQWSQEFLRSGTNIICHLQFYNLVIDDP